MPRESDAERDARMVLWCQETIKRDVDAFTQAALRSGRVPTVELISLFQALYGAGLGSQDECGNWTPARVEDVIAMVDALKTLPTLGV